MKILVADDEPVARRVLTAFLARTGHEILVAEDGTQALKLAQAQKEPYLAIVDWIMPGLTGVQVCAGIRSAVTKFRPYIIMLSAKADKADVAAALDVGADDYLSKPFNPGELMARLRVAERTVVYQMELQKQIGQLESLIGRYNLLGEMLCHPATLMPVDAPAAAVAPGVPSAGASTAAAKLEVTDAQLDGIVNRALAALKLGMARFRGTCPAESRGTEYVSWAGVILLREQVHYDLLLQMDKPVAEALYSKALRRPPASDRDTLRFLSEIQTVVVSGVRSALQSKDIESLQPFLSAAIGQERVARMPELKSGTLSRRYDVEGGTLLFTLHRTDSRVLSKLPSQLRQTDVLAEAFPPPEVNEIPLLNRGVVLTDRFIEKLTSFSEVGTLSIPVFEKSPLASLFGAEAGM